MIYLTGDVHHTDSRMGDQKRLPAGWTEVRTCEVYLEAANKHSISPTLFFTGRAVEEEADFVGSLASRYQFEIGGHTYSANHPRILLGLSRRLLGLANGPYWLQRADMSATARCIRDKLGVAVSSWRNHAYRMDRNTYRIAAELGIRQVSNKVMGVDGEIREVDGVLEVPINTLPDHESLGHDDHKPVCSSAEDWVNQILRQVEYQQAHGLPSVILAHPLCMFVEDRLAAFARLCAAIGGKNTAPLRECAALSHQSLPVGQGC
jgi:peptidoglycan/xylan/chitin deacetylase (PgdA/CDA1 family)